MRVNGEPRTSLITTPNGQPPARKAGAPVVSLAKRHTTVSVERAVLRSPLPPSTLATARAYRKRRMVEEVARHDCAAILLFDPVNIRYANGDEELYDHDADQYEWINLAGVARFADVKKELAKLLPTTNSLPSALKTRSGIFGW